MRDMEGRVSFVEAPEASLIRLAVPFGLTERLVRTSIGRLANEEWVSFERSGRASFYSLTTNGRARFAARPSVMPIARRGALPKRPP